MTAQNESDWAPFNFNENGIPKGFSIDLMDQLPITNLKVGGTLGMAYEDPTPLFFAVRKDQKILARILEKAMTLLSDEEIRNLRIKWFGAIQTQARKVSLSAEEKYCGH